MEHNDVEIGGTYSFQPAKKTVGWTIDYKQLFRHQDISPQQYVTLPVKVLHWSDVHESFAVHFKSDRRNLKRPTLELKILPYRLLAALSFGQRSIHTRL